MRLSAGGWAWLSRRKLLACALVLLAPARGLAAAIVQEFECRFEDLVRKIEISRVIPERPLPCQVVYKKPTEEPGVSRVLWEATRDPAFCTRKARELLGRLETGGWACAAPAPAADHTLALSFQNADKSTVDPALRQAVNRDLERLKQHGGKRVAAKIAALGDLDGDGAEDAVALITFDVDGPDRSQHLVAYLFDDGAFRPAASRFIGGRFRDVYDGEVEGIQDGAIMLHLRTLEPGDASCCPSGSRRATFLLKDGELVRAE